MRQRLTLVPIPVYEKFSWIEGSLKNQVNNNYRLNSTSDYNLLSITKILYVLSMNEPLYFSLLYQKSGIRMKNSFLRYINLLQKLGFVKKGELPVNGRRYYSITDKGKSFLKLLGDDN